MEAGFTSGLAAIAGRDTSGGSVAIWLLRVEQPKEADGLSSTSMRTMRASAVFR
jgi:hypothetical protein